MKRFPAKFFLVVLSILTCPSVCAAQGSFPFLAEVREDAVNVRAGQNKNFELLCQLKKGEEVVVLEKNFSWYKIQLPAKADIYISDKYLKKLKGGKGEVTADKVNLRAGPGINFSIVGKVLMGEMVEIRDFKDGWYKISPKIETYGFVLEDFLAFKSNTIPVIETEALIAPEPKDEIVKETLKPMPPVKANVTVEGELVAYSGSLEGVYYQLKSGSTNVYLIKGLRHVLEQFIGFRVRVEGSVETNSQASSPLFDVAKIQLIL